MLNAFAPRRGSLRGLRLVSFHNSAHPMALRVTYNGLDTLFRDLHDSPSEDKGDPAPRAGMSAEKPSVRVSLDLTGYEDYFKQAAKFKQDIWRDWGKTMSQHESKGQSSEEASQPASEANDTAAATPNDPTQQSPSYLSWDAQKAGPSLYRAFLQEFQLPAQGSVGSLVKRLVERAHKHEHQRLAEELSEKEKVLQEQASQLHAMTADRDKWMMDHQELVASATQQSKMTEAQLRAAASVTAKRADDEALHARQKLAELQQQLSSQAGGDMTGRQTSGKSNCQDHITSSQASKVTGDWDAQALPRPDGEEVFRKLQAVQEDSAQLLHHMTCQLQSASQHPEVNHLLGRELDIAVRLSQIISDRLQIIPGDLRGIINSHLWLLNAYRGAESQMSEVRQQHDAAVNDLEQASEMSRSHTSEAMADKHLDDIVKPNWRSGHELRLLREDREELHEQIADLKAETKHWHHRYMYRESRNDHEEALEQPKGRHQELQEPEDSGQKATDSRQTESGKAKDSGQTQAGKGKDSRQDLSPGQQQVERLCAELKRAQAAFEDWAEGAQGPGRPLATDDAISSGEAPSNGVHDILSVSKNGPRSGSKSGQEDYSDSEWAYTPDSDVSFRRESGCEVHGASAEPYAISRLIHSAVSNGLKAGTSVPDSNLGKLAAAEEELKELVKTMSIHGRKWADSKDALEQAANQQAKGEDLQCALDNLVDHLNNMREHVDMWSDAVYDTVSDAEDDEEQAACEAKEAVAAIAECVARMHRFKATSKPTGV